MVLISADLHPLVAPNEAHLEQRYPGVANTVPLQQQEACVLIHVGQNRCKCCSYRLKHLHAHLQAHTCRHLDVSAIELSVNLNGGSVSAQWTV